MGAKKGWTSEEIGFIKENISNMKLTDMSKIIDRSAKAIKRTALKLGLRAMDGRFVEDLKMGEKYGQLTIIGSLKKKSGKNTYKYYICECECKNVREIPKFNLINGFSNSCGCVGRNEKLLPEGETSINEKYASCRQAASVRNLEFDLTLIQYSQIISQNCHYCDAEPKNYNRYLKKDGSIVKTALKVNRFLIDRSWAKINTVDRIDSNKGYSIKNCVPACWPCNEAKMDTPYDKFIERAYKIVEHQNKKKVK